MALPYEPEDREALRKVLLTERFGPLTETSFEDDQRIAAEHEEELRREEIKRLQRLKARKRRRVRKALSA